MKVVLLKSVDNLGQAGDAVEVRRGYYRNFLGPRAMALQATETNIRIVESRKKKLESLVALEKSDADRIKIIIDGGKLQFKLRAGDRGQVFGSISSKDVVTAIKDQFNVAIERRRVDMEILKTLGNHAVKVRIYPGVVAVLTATIERLLQEGETVLDESADAAPKEVFGGMARYEDDE